MDIVFGATRSGGSHSNAGGADGHVQATSHHHQYHNPFASAQQVPSAATSQASLSHEDNGPILYDEPNRTSAIDDIRSGVIYAFIFTLFFTFFLILPGIRNEKFPTILCIVPSLLVASIIVISIFGTTWHVGEAPNISAAYKAFSRDRIQDGPIIMENMAALSGIADGGFKSRDIEELEELDGDFGLNRAFSSRTPLKKKRRSLRSSSVVENTRTTENLGDTPAVIEREGPPINSGVWGPKAKTKTTIRRLNVDINYNERFYWIEPQQMRHEYHQALEKGLPYPILTVVEYLSQDDAGFNWSRQYRSAGYYASILLWLSFCVCILMFCLHCATPKYGIYTMQILGLLLLFTNLIYATLVPRGDRELVIPFEGQSLRFRFGWNFWLVLIGGCVSLVVGTIIVIIDLLKPNFIFTTVLDVDFDRNYSQSRQRQKCLENLGNQLAAIEAPKPHQLSSKEQHYASQKPKYPPFMNVKNSSKPSRSSTKQQNHLQSPVEASGSYPRQRHSPKSKKESSDNTDGSVERTSNQDSIDIRL